MILFGERSLSRAIHEFMAHYHHERKHKGMGSVLLFPATTTAQSDGPITCRPQLGGLLKYYHRPAAYSARASVHGTHANARRRSTIEVPLVAGREFTRADNETAPAVALVDDTMAAPFGSAFVVIAIASLAACFVPAWRADADRSTPRCCGGDEATTAHDAHCAGDQRQRSYCLSAAVQLRRILTMRISQLESRSCGRSWSTCETLRKASTTAGSKCVPLAATMNATAASCEIGAR